MDAENYPLSNVFNGVLIGLLYFVSFSLLGFRVGRAMHGTKMARGLSSRSRVWADLRTSSLTHNFLHFSDDKGCAFELYYRNGRILAQSYVVTRYIEHLDFSGLRLDRKSLQLKDRRETKANCRVAPAQAIINEYSENVDAQLSNNRF